MGQIVGGAAKPKRCNINQLSQLGTPAAGEHILVSSDNSMNAAGQGNFDCYIVGDGVTAATALEIKMINPEIYESAPYIEELNLASYTKNNKFINSSNEWATQNGSNSINISVNAGETIAITSNSNYGAIIAFLKSNTVVGTAVDFSTSYNGRISLTAGETDTYVIPEDCTILYVFNKTSTDTFTPSSIKVSKVAITKIETFDTDLELIKKNLYGTERTISVPLVQGYATADIGQSKIEIGSMTNRIRTWVLQGSYTIKLKEGYVVRGVAAWNGGITEGNPSETFSASDVSSLTPNIIQSTFQKTDSDTEYSIVTICKTDASASISPSEDCIESITASNEDGIVDIVGTLKKEVNGTIKEFPITFAQGYVSQKSSSAAQVTSLSTRVMACVLTKGYTIKTNSGYVIRNITAWNGGSLEEGDMPTQNITGISSCINLVSNAALTEYTHTDTRKFFIATFCKVPATSDVLPSENIVKSCTAGEVGILEETKESKVIKKVLFMGDSINYGLASYFNGTKSGVLEITTNRISDFFAQMTGAQVDNIAARGTGYVADTRNLGNGWEKAQVTDYSNYNLVCICLGINDYIQHVSIGTLEANAEGTVIGNMTRIINKIMTDNPLCKVVIFSPYNSWGQVCDDSGSEYQVADYYGDESTDYALGHAIRGHTLTEYITAIDSVCAAYHIQHVKLSESGMINKANIKKVLADGLHPIVDVRPMLAAELFGRKMYD